MMDIRRTRNKRGLTPKYHMETTDLPTLSRSIDEVKNDPYIKNKIVLGGLTTGVLPSIAFLSGLAGGIASIPFSLPALSILGGQLAVSIGAVKAAFEGRKKQYMDTVMKEYKSKYPAVDDAIIKRFAYKRYRLMQNYRKQIERYEKLTKRRDEKSIMYLKS
jgi:hypothetical protein